MKLYDVPRNTRIRLIEDARVPVDSANAGKDNELNFSHIDGMYSYCTDDNGDPVHIAAWTEVEIVVPMPVKEKPVIRDDELDRKLEPNL
jgi:hypothetical protein